MTLFTKYLRQFLPVFAVIALVALPAAAFADANGAVSGSVNAQTLISFPLFANGVYIGANGNVLVRGAKVESVSGNTITAQSSWGSAVVAWTVDAANASFFNDKATADASGISAVKVGDTLSFAGSINQSASAFTVNATTVRDWSIVPVPPIATSTPPHLDPMPVMPGPFHFWNTLKANIGAHLGLSL